MITKHKKEKVYVIPNDFEQSTWFSVEFYIFMMGTICRLCCVCVCMCVLI